MYEHMVFFKLKESTSREKEQDLLEMLLALKGKIPEIAELTAGFNKTEETDKQQGYSLGLRVTFESKQALDEYLPHPAHQEFVSAVQKEAEDVVVVDYPIR